MTRNWGSALVAACMGLVLLVPTQTVAQVEWVTSLNPAPVPVAMTQQNAIAASDGSSYAVGLASDGETNRVRLSHLSSSGVLQWVRWTTGGAVNTRRIPLWAHADNSVSVLSKDPASSKFCMENFSASGVSQARWCASGYSGYYPVTQAPDGDFYYVDTTWYRAIKKMSPLGVEQWSHQETEGGGILAASGVDSAGNYYEVSNFRLRTWSIVDGSRLNNVVIGGQGSTLLPSLPRAGRDLVLVRGTAALSNAVAAAIVRNGANGALYWIQTLIFPGSGASDSISLAAADGDGTYVIRTTGAEGDSQVAKLSASGAVIWQRHYSRIRRIVEGPNGLVAIRTDTNTGAGTSDTYMFPISASDGSLGTPVIYSRSDVFAPTDWFPVSGGLVGVMQGSNPFAPFTGFPTSVAASMVFVESSLPVNRWIVAAESRPPTSVLQSDCLMPRSTTSSPSSWWVRTQPVSQTSAANWTAVDTASGTTLGRSTPSATGCGPSITQDGGQVVVSVAGSDRVKKFDASGATVWQAPSAVSPSLSSTQPLVKVGVNGDTSYVVGSVVGRVSGAGTILFETDINRPSPRYLAIDSANNTWVVSGTTDAVVSKLSPTGVLLWSNLVFPNACSNALMSSLLTPSDEMLVATQSCGQGQIFRVDATGQSFSGATIIGAAPRVNVQLRALKLDSAGNIYAGGCASSSVAAFAGSDGFSFVVSVAPGGSLIRWTAQTDLFAGAAECVNSIAIDSNDNLYAAASSGDALRAPTLWSFTSTGVERWRHSGVLSSPFAFATHLAVDSGGKLIALGEALPGASGSREASVRRINVASLASSLNLKFLEVPSAPVGYRDQFPVRIGLRTVGDIATNATSDVVVSLGVQNGAGALDGSHSCTIVAGASECVVNDSRYGAVGSGVTLSAGADGFATVVSGPISIVAGTTTATVSVLSPGPYLAFSVAHARAAVLGAPPVTGQAITGAFDGPTTPGDIDVACTSVPPTGSLPWRECDFLVRSSAMPLAAQWLSTTSTYTGSASTPLSLSVIKVTPTLQVTSDPSNTNISGDRIRLRVSLLVSSGLNVSKFVPVNSITVSGGGSCGSIVNAGGFSDGYSGSYILCEVPPHAAGMLTINFAFAGDGDLLPAGSVNQSLVISDGAVLRVTGTSFPFGALACSPTPGVSCSVTAPGYNEWQCAGPAGMSGQVFFFSSPGNGNTYFPTSPQRFSNVTGLATSNITLPWTFSSQACALDVDGDGARMSVTDGILILRRMLGFPDTALLSGATHSCVPRTAAAIAQAINLSAYDVDGDGETHAETDGVLLLRAMLGFRGDALIAGAVGVNATRKTATEIENFFVYSCDM